MSWLNIRFACVRACVRACERGVGGVGDGYTCINIDRYIAPTRTHARTHARTHTHTHARALNHTRRTHARTHIHTRARTHLIILCMAS